MAVRGALAQVMQFVLLCLSAAATALVAFFGWPFPLQAGTLAIFTGWTVIMIAERKSRTAPTWMLGRTGWTVGVVLMAGGALFIVSSVLLAR